MSDVKRYKKHGEILGRVLVAAQDGDYVKYADYAALQARVAELEAERDARIDPDYVQGLVDLAEPMLSAALGAAEGEIEELQARVAVMEATIKEAALSRLAHLGQAADAKARADAAEQRVATLEALLSEAVKAGVLEGVVVATQYHDEVVSWVQKVKALPSMANKSYALRIAEILGALANHSQTIDRIAAQLKDGQG